MEKSGKPSGSKARASKARDRAGRTPQPHPNALFSSSADGAPVGPRGAPDADIPDTGAMPTAMGVEAKLVVEKGLHAGKVLRLGAGTAVIGRSSKCELSLKGSSGVSRRHCKVQFIGNQYALIDLESRNGTLVNGKVQPRFILKDGDLIEVCDEQIRFVSVGAAAQVPVADDDLNDRETKLLPAEAAAKQLKQPLPPLEEMPDAPVDDDLAAPTRAERSRSTPAARSTPSKPPPLPPERPSEAAFEGTDHTKPFLQPELDDEAAAAQTAPQRAPAKIPPPRPPPIPRDAPRPARPRGGFDDLQAETLRGPPQKKEGGFRGVHAVLLLMLVIVALLGVAAWDLTLGPKRLKAVIASFQIQEVEPPAKPDEKPSSQLKPDPSAPDAASADAGAAATDAQSGDAGAATQAPAGDALAKADPPADTKPADAKPTDAKRTDAKPTDATPTDAKPTDAKPTDAKPTDARPTDAKPTDAKPADAVDVVAKTGGTVARVVVKVGQKIAKGAVVAQLDGGGGSRKKLEVLYGEKRDFEAAVKKGIASAQRDLEAVEREIASLERKSRNIPLTSSEAGTVVELKVKAGDTIKAGDALVSLRP